MTVRRCIDSGCDVPQIAGQPLGEYTFAALRGIEWQCDLCSRWDCSYGFSASLPDRATHSPRTFPYRPGPYASWSDAERASVARAMERRCIDLERSGPQIPSKSESAKINGREALYKFCLLSGMPADWPPRSKFEEEVKSLVATAKSADPAMPDSVFAEIVASLGEIKPEPPRGRTANAIPAGPYASWSEEDKKRTEQKVLWGCATLAAMAFSAPPKSKEAQQEGVVAFMLGCTANTMPSDWPSMSQYRARAAEHAASAKRLDPTIPDMLLSGNLGLKP